MSLGPLIVAACTVFLCWYLINMRSRLPNPQAGTRHPPCLTSFPVVGSLPLLKGETNELAHQLMEKSKSLGTVFALYFGSQYTVVLNGVDTIRDALVSKSLQFAGRFPFYVEQKINVNRKGIVSSPYDDAFRYKHQLYLSILKQFGFGQRIMEARINESVEEFIQQVKTTEGQPFNPSQTIELNLLNVIASILVGHRYPPGHQTLIDIKTRMHDWVTGLGAEVDFFPLLRFVPPYRGRMYSTIASHQLLLNTLDKTFSDVLATKEQAVDGDENDSFIRQITQSIKSREINSRTTLLSGDDVKMRLPVEFDREELLFTLRDLFSGGADTSSTTMCWFLILMANHPEVQTRMQKEIDAVIGRDRLPSLNDEQSMPYSQAVMLETMRRYTLLPLSVFRSTTCDTVVKDVFVPANTMVIVNLYSAHMDPTVWKDPRVFRPERFLDEHGSVYGRERLLSFSLGKRSCPGESLARQQLFLFMTGTVQNFDVRPPEELRKITFKELSAVTLQPTPFEVRMIARLR